jgi:hypothetical protein
MRNGNALWSCSRTASVQPEWGSLNSILRHTSSSGTFVLQAATSTFSNMLIRKERC